jgi:hypothetical protein
MAASLLRTGGTKRQNGGGPYKFLRPSSNLHHAVLGVCSTLHIVLKMRGIEVMPEEVGETRLYTFSPKQNAPNSFELGRLLNSPPPKSARGYHADTGNRASVQN